MRDGPSERGTGLSGFRRYTWWSLTGSITVSLVLFVRAWAMDEGVVPWVRGVSGLALAVLVVAAVVLVGRRLDRVPGDPGPGHQVGGHRTDGRHPGGRAPAGRSTAGPGGFPAGWLVVGGLAAAVLGAVPLALRDDGLWPVAPAVMVSITATFLRPAHRRTLIAGAVVAAAALGGGVALASGDEGWLLAAAFPAGMVASVAWMALGMLWAWDVADRLDQARRLAAELAVKDERLRFAADLHDIQGHHLQVIALKSELAERLVEGDPARAAAEMREVRRLAADALRDTRAVVQGYRRTTLEDEIANAAKVLTAAGIDTAVDRDQATGAPTLPEPARHLLGLVMREATTNVLRHSRAGHARIAYRVEDGHARLLIGNDGAADPPRPDAGTGLRTLAGRLEQAGGTLDWRRDGDRFEVVASLPAGAPAYPAGVSTR
ncbi:sensor histidine kinase [Nonomuraea muscovyensis]|uniref:Two-component system sensor histidine kinase DesK n=1 Tax=Nonomuraea muscovyensis TaxID=1124761 RepID=A0A7X0EXL7_9ACTN|nr:histidine kinase [Nonomuraea muscovyensis]MBB6344796.1 two-component system sensor histidine kinase DesK [Nonomuraea muscovyensis]